MLAIFFLFNEFIIRENSFYIQEFIKVYLIIVYLENTPYYFHVLLCPRGAWWFIFVKTGVYYRLSLYI